MSNLAQVRDWCVAAWRTRGTGRALALLLMVLNVLVLPTAVVATNQIAYRAGYIATHEQFRSFALLCGLGVVVSNAVLFGAWLIWRRLPRFEDEEVGLLFIPHGHDGAEPLVIQLYKKLAQDLRGRGLSRIAAVNLIPFGITVENAKEAHLLLEKTNARLLIYGAITIGNVGGEQIRGFRRISFTVRLPALEAERYPALGVRLGEAVIGRRYAFSDKNSFIEEATVTENLSQVARFLLGVALTVSGHWRDAQPILGTLMRDVSAVRNTYPLFNRFRANVRECFEETLLQELNELYENEIVDHITQPEADAAVARSMQLLQQAKSISMVPERYLLSDAIMFFHRGQLAGAAAVLEEARRKRPPDDPAPDLSAAFLALWQGRFHEAVDHYRRAERCGRADPEMVLGVIRFLTALAEAHPDRTELRFAIAFVSDAFMDRDLAGAEFQRFLSESRDDQRRGVARLRRTAEIRLRRLEQRQAGDLRT